MLIKYTEKQVWRKPVMKNPEELYSRGNQKRIRSTMKKVLECKISHIFEPLSQNFLSWFTPMYTELIGKKSNAIVYDLFEKTLNNNLNGNDFLGMTVCLNNTPVGGAIINMYEELFMISYRAFLPKWPSGTLQSSPSLYAEYVTAKEAFAKHKHQVSHGKDRNLFGINSNIGQLMYKLSVGYKPQLPINKVAQKNEVLILDTQNVKQDVVVLQYPDEGLYITKAILVASRETEAKYNQLLQYPKQLEVQVIYRD